ncbi:L,D-transpeptidase Cds6 family protein [Chitinibacter fontanus]|nr:tetratricopeptide repeat protein [Chitinibacter fontanus]
MSALRSIIVALPLLFSMAAFAGDSEDIQQLIRAKQFPQALDRAEKALVKSPKDAQLRFLRGIALSELGRTDDAIKTFTQISEDYPQLPEPYNNLAVLYANKGQFDKARGALQLAIQTNPSYAIAHENMGDLYARLASQAYDKALQLEGGNSQVQTKLKLVDSLFSQQGIKVAAKPAATNATVAVNPKGSITPQPTLAAVTTKPVVTTAPTSKPSAAPTATSVPKASATPKPSATPKATATPKPTAAPDTSKSESAARQQVVASVENWASAWSRQNVNGYINSYAKSFKAPGGRAAWEKDREAKISAPKSIDVNVRDIKVEMIDEKTAKVRLRQDYKSDRLSSSTGKTLIMEKAGNRWLIREERIGG